MSHIMERIVRGREVDKLGKKVRDPSESPIKGERRSLPEHRKIHHRLKDMCQSMTQETLILTVAHQGL